MQGVLGALRRLLPGGAIGDVLRPEGPRPALHRPHGIYRTALVLEEDARITRLERAKTRLSQDGTEKFLFRLEDGHFIESVLIPGKSTRARSVSH